MNRKARKQLRHVWRAKRKRVYRVRLYIDPFMKVVVS